VVSRSKMGDGRMREGTIIMDLLIYNPCQKCADKWHKRLWSLRDNE